MRLLQYFSLREKPREARPDFFPVLQPRVGMQGFAKSWLLDYTTQKKALTLRDCCESAEAVPSKLGYKPSLFVMVLAVLWGFVFLQNFLMLEDGHFLYPK